MRRIFGGTVGITASSTSNSLSSDALASPSSGTNHDPSYAYGQQQPSPPPQPSTQLPFGGSTNEASSEGKKGGWFGGTGFGAFGDNNGPPPTSRSTHNNVNSNSNPSSNGTPSSGLASTYGARPLDASYGGLSPISTTYSGAGQPGGPFDDLEDLKLPFGGSRSGATSPRSPPRGGAIIPGGGGHQRSVSRSSSLQASNGPGSVSGARPFSPFGSSTGAGVAPPLETKDKIMVDLLSGQAVVETKDFQILDWEEMQEVKKEHAVLASKIASLSRSLALETRLRDSAAKLVRLSSPTNGIASPTSSLPNSPNRPRVTKTQAEAQLANAGAKIESISAELYKVGWKEAELRTKLLRHTAGVLGLAMRRKEEEERGSVQTPLSVAGLTSLQNSFNGSSAPKDRQRSVSPGASMQQRFDGHSFFAGNKEAIMPGQSRVSPYASPNLSASNGQFGSMTVDSSQSHIRDLENQVAELQNALAAARDRVDPMQAQQLREELAQARAAERGVRDEHDTTRREAADLRRELEQHLLDLRTAKDNHDSTRRELDDVRQGRSADSQREIEEAKREAEEANQKLHEVEMELNELEQRAVESDRRVADVEDLLEDTKVKHAHELQRSQADLESARDEVHRRSLIAARVPTPAGPSEDELQLRDEVTALRQQRTQVSRAVSDVLRQHRPRAAVLGDVPDFDEAAVDHVDDWSAYVASTLNSHFDRIISHSASLGDEISSTRAEHEGARSSLETELRQAQDHRERWRGEAEQHRRAKEQLEAEHQELQMTVRGHEEMTTSLAPLEQQLAASLAEGERIRQELTAAQAKITSLEAQIADLNAQQQKSTKTLQELYRSMPPLEARQQASNSDDLATLKAAFEPPRRPIGNILGGDKSFSIESLAERIRVLLAEDSKLVQKLLSLEHDSSSSKKEIETHRSNAERYQKLADQHSTNLTATQKQLKELEERIEVSSNQEVTMLERLNDLTESLETTRAEKRKLETTAKATVAQVEALEAEKAKLMSQVTGLKEENGKLNARPDHSTRLAQLENQVQDLKDQLADTEEELEDSKKREAKTRGQLLEELSSTQAEVSSLKTKLRQAERKASAKA